MSTPASLVWFDYETFGISPMWDHPSQFAGLRTDLDLNPIEDAVVLYCQPPADYLPSPHACRVTGQLPQDVMARGLPEREFIARVLNELGRPGTCSLGYNSIRFDDEFTRHTAFRNLLDPYEHEWKSGNSRWDLLDVVRLTRALRPEGIEWPSNADGSASNRLEHLTAANGLEHRDAHDAMSDVLATIDVARLIRQQQPRLYHYLFEHKDKQSIASLLNVRERQPVIQVSGMIPGSRSHLGIVKPLCRHPVNSNGVVVLDLHSDPEEWLDLSSEALAARLYARGTQPGDPARPGLRTVHINKCPVIVPLATLRPTDAERLGVDVDTQLDRGQHVEARLEKELVARISQVMQGNHLDDPDRDVDGTLYSGAFLSQADRSLLTQLRDSSPQELASAHTPFDDDRLPEILFRFRARNHPDTLSQSEQASWLAHCRERLLETEPAPWTNNTVFEQEMQAIEWTASEANLKAALFDYRDSVVAPLLGND